MAEPQILTVLQWLGHWKCGQESRALPSLFVAHLPVTLAASLWGVEGRCTLEDSWPQEEAQTEPKGRETPCACSHSYTHFPMSEREVCDLRRGWFQKPQELADGFCRWLSLG